MDEMYEVFALKYADRDMRTRSGGFLFDNDHASPRPMDQVPNAQLSDGLYDGTLPVSPDGFGTVIERLRWAPPAGPLRPFGVGRG